MLSTQQKFPPLYICFLSYAILSLAQWPASYLMQNFSLTLGILLNEWVVVAGLSLLIARAWQIPRDDFFPTKKMGRSPLLQTLWMTFALVILIDYLMFFSEKWIAPTPEIKAMLEKIMAVEGIGDGAWRWFLICLSPAICEELFFRGFFQGTLQHYWGGKWALIVTALAFTLIHGIPAYWHLYFILGLFLGWLMLTHRNLLFPILAHLLNNSWTFITHNLGYTVPLP